MQFGICNEIFRGWKLGEAMRFARSAGYDAVEIAPFTLAPRVTDITPAGRKEIREEAARAGIAISGIHWVLAQTEGLHLTHPDAGIRAATSTYFRELVDFCADIGGSSIVIGSPKQRNLLPEVSPAQGMTWAGETLREAVRRGEERGITLCIEPLAPSETNFLNTAAEAIAFIQRMPSPRLKIILDVKAMSSEAKPIPQVIRESGSHFAYFHANDKNLKGPGFGEIDFVPIATALRESGYRGMVSVEVFDFEEGPEAIATRSLEYLRRCFRRNL
ncbi:MAG TPA: D-tagatose 3-epimerase [Verrucomicrobiales bacterium]|nr:D-tagatose 3-epimerase [Verrucomicrobiales bacterium]